MLQRYGGSYDLFVVLLVLSGMMAVGASEVMKQRHVAVIGAGWAG